VNTAIVNTPASPEMARVPYIAIVLLLSSGLWTELLYECGTPTTNAAKTTRERNSNTAAAILIPPGPSHSMIKLEPIIMRNIVVIIVESREIPASVRNIHRLCVLPVILYDFLSLWLLDVPAALYCRVRSDLPNHSTNCFCLDRVMVKYCSSEDSWCETTN
jgi:hypothetical protein